MPTITVTYLPNVHEQQWYSSHTIKIGKFFVFVYFRSNSKQENRNHLITQQLKPNKKWFTN